MRTDQIPRMQLGIFGIAALAAGSLSGLTATGTAAARTTATSAPVHVSVSRAPAHLLGTVNMSKLAGHRATAATNASSGYRVIDSAAANHHPGGTPER